MSEEQNVNANSSNSSSPISISLSIGGRDFDGNTLRPPNDKVFINNIKVIFWKLNYISNIPGALIGFLALPLITVLLGLLIAVRVLLTVFFLIATIVFFSILLVAILANFDVDSFTTVVGFAVITAFSAASLIYIYIKSKNIKNY